MALFRKLFYRKPPDGLLEICDRVFVFDSCFAADALEQKNYKGYVGKIISQLKEHYPDASILAFNFREGETQSQVANALTEYDTTVMEYPQHYEGCPLLPMEVMHHFLRSSESWLSLGLQNVLFMHCEHGGWPVLAFMLSALLLYRKHYSGELRTLDMVYKQAPREVLQSFSPLNPVPSQLRYLQYISRRNVATEWPPLDRELNLDCIIIRTIPDVDGEGGCRPIFRVYGQDPLQVSNQAPKVLFSTSKQSKTVRSYKQAECELVKIDINCQIQGDVVMECIHLHYDTEREKMIFRVMFNMAFIRSNILILNRDEIDILWDSKDLFPKDFRAEVLFSEMDTATSVVPVDYFRFEEKDGLPIEAFGKVQEIFSGVDWLVPKGDNAIEGIQQSPTEKSQISQSFAPTDDVDRKKSDPHHSPSGIGSIITPEQTPSPVEDHILTSSALPPQQHSDGKALNVVYKQQSDSNSIQSDMAKDVIPRSEADTSYLKTSPSTSTSQPTKDDAVGLEQLLLPPVNQNAAISPSRDENSRSHLTASLNKVVNDTAPHSPPHPSIVENSVSTSRQTPVASSPPSASPLKENSTHEVGPSHPPPATLHMTQSATNRVGACPPPPPPPPVPSTESSSIKEVDSVPPTVPQPPSTSPFREPPNSEAVPQPPSTPPLRDNSVAKHAPPPAPPPEHSTGERSNLTPPTCSGHSAPPPLPPPPLEPHLRDTSTIRHAPCPPPSPPPPAPANHYGSDASSSPSVPSAPSPPFPSTKQPPGAPSPPPPSLPPPGTKGKSLLSRGANSRNSQTNKLKPLHWLKISRAVSGSLWAEAQKSGEAAKAPEIDMSELESLFSAAAPNTDKGNKTGSKASAAPKPEKVQLIDHRRAYNCEIMLSKVKIPLPDMLNSVLALEESALDVDQVDNLIKFCPTKEEMEMLKSYKGEKDKLGKCEQFFLELMQVPRIEYKLRVFSFKIQFCSQVSDLRNSLNVVTSSADQIKGSAKFKRIMQTILSLGNALNQGTARGSAVGFRLDSLLKLTETRARNNKMTLMHYLCKVLSDKLPELLDFWKDFSSLEPASKVQLKFLAEEMQTINKGLEKVVQELSMSENDGAVSEKFRKALKEFLRFAEGEVRSLASLYSGVGRNVDSLILYFGEDPARCPYEQVVTTLMNFVRMFKQAHDENLKQQEADKKKAEKESSDKPKKIDASETEQVLQSSPGSVK